MQERSFANVLELYDKELFGSVLPFWLERGLDSGFGGYFTCFSNDGNRLLHRHKFTWSQGRFVWMLARLSRSLVDRIAAGDRQRYLELAASGAEFLMKHARLENGNCSFILDRRGRPILLDSDGRARQAEAGEGYDLSIYADFFVIYGLGEYARASGSRKAFDFAWDLYRHVLGRLAGGNYRTDPYPVPAGYRVHGEPMITLETAQELAEAAAGFGLERETRSLQSDAERCCREIMTLFRRPEKRAVLEMIGTDGQPKETLLGRFINPGHTLEDMWFVMHWAVRTLDERLFAEAAETVRWALEKGWDDQYGGLFLFRDREGEQPQGEVPAGLAEHEMVRKVRADWSNKLWWVHSEALYALLLALEKLSLPWLEEWFWKVHEYTLGTFPNPDRKVGEWIQIRDRQGRPESKVVALPVKDPFHIVRALTLALPVVERLAGREK